MTRHFPLILILLIGASLALSACGSTSSHKSSDRNISNPSPAQPVYDEQALARLEQNYKNNPEDLQAAIAYSKALREADYLNRAAIVMRPFANNQEIDAGAKVEYSAIQLALGNDLRAEDYARMAIKQDKDNAQAYHYLGIALDSRDDHKEAEDAFRKALKLEPEKSITVMNNLALNLASQGEFEESLSLLQEAATLAPGRTDIMRNLRIVETLQRGAPPKSKKGGPPLPARKPPAPKES